VLTIYQKKAVFLVTGFIIKFNTKKIEWINKFLFQNLLVK